MHLDLEVKKQSQLASIIQSQIDNILPKIDEE